jgi:hypothetical protein
MKHAGPQALDRLQPLLVALRRCAGLVERTPGSFYRKGAAFLHFHEDPAGLFADVKLDGKHFERFCVSTGPDQASLMARVRALVDSAAGTRG